MSTCDASERIQANFATPMSPSASAESTPELQVGLSGSFK